MPLTAFAIPIDIKSNTNRLIINVTIIVRIALTVLSDTELIIAQIITLKNSRIINVKNIVKPCMPWYRKYPLLQI